MVTLKDVAERAGVSTATVSYVLNNRKKISEEVTKKVHQAIQELDYQPNMMARALRSNKSNIIGVLSEDITSYQVNNIVKGINEIADQEKYQILLSDLGLGDKIWNGSFQDYTKVMNYQDQIQEKLNIFRLAGVGSIIYVGMHDRDITGLLQTDMPLVYAYNYTKNPEDIMVSSDNQKISYQTVSFMIEKGHRRIGLISGPVDSIPAFKRLIGYQTALMEAGISMDPQLVTYGNWSHTSGMKECRKLMELKDAPTAIFSMNDWMAVGAMKAMKEMGIQAGKDVEIVGFDDIELCLFSEPQLSTIRVPLEEIGREAARKITQMSEKKEMSNNYEELPCTFIERESFIKKQ